MRPKKKSIHLRRLAATGLIITLAAVAFYPLSLHLLSRVYCHLAEHQIRKGYYGLASVYFEKALSYQPDEDVQILKGLSGVYRQLAELHRVDAKKISYATRAKEGYLRGARLNPFDAEIAFGAAMSEALLEETYASLHPQSRINPYHAAPHFKRALGLRPNGLLYHYAFCRYLYNHGTKDDLIKTVCNLARIHPPVYAHLKNEKFWSSSVKVAVRNGLEQARYENISTRAALKALSSLFASDKAWAGAIEHYENALRFQPFNNRAGDYMHLGRLCLKGRRIEEANHHFLKGIEKSRSRERALAELYHVFKNEGLKVELYRFYKLVDNRFDLSDRTGIFMARSLIDLEQYEQARPILINMIRSAPTGEAYYLLARIAEIEEDWGRMELAIQRATLFEPAKLEYRTAFIRLLKRLGKLESAEREIGQAIISANRSPWLFNERAQIRWKLKNYAGALEDWESAIRLSPRKAAYYVKAAEGWFRIGEWERAVAYYRKVVEMEPDNKQYRKRFEELTYGN
ncbi:MAG: tetratricopeptide repeat protein [Pseudomonadota bacterium]